MSMDHSFWLFREGERAYNDNQDLWGRHDAPVLIDDEILHYFFDTLAWTPTFNPAKKENGNGLNTWGLTIINQIGGALFHHVFATWVQLLGCGPEHLMLQGLFQWQWPYNELEHIMNEAQLHKLGKYKRLEVDRDWLISQLTMLAQFGELAATGEFYILHLGI